MPRQDVDVGSGASANDGDIDYDAWVKTNANVTELFQGAAFSGAVDPVDGTTRAYAVGQLYWNRVGKRFFEATSASTNPVTSGAGSAWAEISLGTTTTTITVEKSAETDVPDVNRSNGYPNTVTLANIPQPTVVEGGSYIVRKADGSERLVFEEQGGAWVQAALGGTASTVTAYNTLAALPDATTLTVGTQATVVNDGTASNNGTYVVAGANVGSNGIGWVK